MCIVALQWTGRGLRGGVIALEADILFLMVGGVRARNQKRRTATLGLISKSFILFTKKELQVAIDNVHIF